MSTLKSRLLQQSSHGPRWGKYPTEFLEREFAELRGVFGGLQDMEFSDGRAVIRGRLGFTVPYVEGEIRDAYEVEIDVPREYPDLPPQVRETGGRIHPDPDHHVNGDGTLCLGAPVQVMEVFRHNRTLLGFVRELVVQQLSKLSFKERYGRISGGELSHGGKGLLEFYKAYFHTNDDLAVLRLLKVIVTGKYDGRKPCPCGKPKKLGRCHGNILARVSKYPIDFSSEYRWVAAVVKRQD